jgi:chemotaxis protein MotB
MARFWLVLVALMALSGCGVSRSDYDAKAHEADPAKQPLASLQAQLSQTQQQLATTTQQIAELRGALGIAQSQALTSDQKAQLDEAKRAMQEADERGKLVDDLQAKFKKMVDAGHLKVTTRHGRVVLQMHNDVLFGTGESEIKPDGQQAIAEVAATLRQVGSKRFQVAGHTDAAPIRTEKKKEFPTNWELSAARAIAVVKLLVGHGVDPATLSAAGYGPYDPIASNATPDGQAKNRRIEITLVPHITEFVPSAQNDKSPTDKGQSDKK